MLPAGKSKVMATNTKARAEVDRCSIVVGLSCEIWNPWGNGESVSRYSTRLRFAGRRWR
jgi:hypothetical protein